MSRNLSYKRRCTRLNSLVVRARGVVWRAVLRHSDLSAMYVFNLRPVSFRVLINEYSAACLDTERLIRYHTSAQGHRDLHRTGHIHCKPIEVSNVDSLEAMY